MEHDAIESLVARSPVLEILNIEGWRTELCLRLVSQSLRCVQICSSVMESITMAKAPCLERLIPSGRVGRGAFRVRIVDAPKLHTFGFLEPGQVLEVGKTAIMPGIKASTSTMLTTVKILSLNVRFGVRSDVKMVPTFLKCFPNMERLHIMVCPDFVSVTDMRHAMLISDL
uniref:F-box/LRR-repeat protein 15/At3g58940/PEG3-like LRR domain-containing protein n=1 Tax=Aegilops tauschii TaxID=37682 RepID=M8BYG5_AEGTA